MSSNPTRPFDPVEMIPALFFLAVGGFFLADALFSIGLDASSAGSATFATIVSVLLIGVGLVLIVRGLRTRGEPLQFLALPKLLLVLASPIVFGLAVRPLGLVPALVLTLLCASMADTAMPLKRRASMILAITVLCVAVFHYGLNLPFPLVTGLNVP